ncbi:hypothetical protein MKX01_040110 [Papaver californicum]|nr:hypothetical protein MKX01_040110 [Papaver californicum]
MVCKRDYEETKMNIINIGKNIKQFDVIINDDLMVHDDADNADYSKPGEKDYRTKKIMEDWETLKERLPPTIFVRGYKGYKDLLRAVIVGEPGTPFHDGLFFFDIDFPSSYPNEPPIVTYHSYGIRLHPNMKSDGKVCLSLLNTSKMKKEWKTDLSKSNVLKVLTSIQEHILNSNPYVSKPNKRVLSKWFCDLEKKSLKYNEETFVLNCKTMLKVLHKPPKDFEFFVAQHFRDRADTILRACLAYFDGIKVGIPIEDYDDSLASDTSSVSSSTPSSPSKVVTSKSKNFRGATDDLYSRFYQAFSKNGSTFEYFVDY